MSETTQERFDRLVKEVSSNISRQPMMAHDALGKLRKEINELITTNSFLLRSADTHRLQNEKLAETDKELREHLHISIMSLQSLVRSVQAYSNPAPKGN